MDQAEQNLARGNESFYRSDPGDYIETRLQMLVLAGAKQPELGDLLSAGVEYAGITIGPDSDTVQDPDDDSLQRFITIESQQLLHHACETALRLFLVHASDTNAPWIELNRERSPKKFKETARSTFIDNIPDAALVAFVCLGRSTRPDDVAPEQWDGAVSTFTAFLTQFARCILDDAEIYNGIKHGLGVSAGDAVLLLDSVQVGGGASVEFPVSGPWLDNGTRIWSLKTRWVDVRWSLGIVKVAVHLINSMWAIGRQRHIGGEEGTPLWVPSGFRPDDMRSADRHGGQHMTWHLATETDLKRAKPN